MRFFRHIAIISMVSACTIAFSTTSYAHSEAESARFVSAEGSDNSDCKNRFRPCKSISYAAQQANKGDNIIVAQGTYAVADEQTLVYLLSDTQKIYGGYTSLDNYQSQSPDKFITTLTGVPSAYVDTLFARGFHIISDTKSLDSEHVQKRLSAMQLSQQKQSASPCIDGRSAGFRCRNISLLGHLPLSELPTQSATANDIWGHVDLNNMREYALIGLRAGVAIIDVSEPSSPQVVASIQGQSTTWRDIKVHQFYDASSKRFKAFAYVGADNVNEGIVILDLSALPDRIDVVGRNISDRQSHNVYISGVNYSTNTSLSSQSPLLHVTGSENFGGSWRSYTMNDSGELDIAFRQNSASRSDYTHDASSLLIDDVRASRDCNTTDNGMCNIIVDFNEQEIRLWEHNSPSSANQLGQASYPNVSYVHSGWWTEDKQYIFVHDELDERNFSLNTTINIFEISDLNRPSLVSTWTGPTRAVDHNGFVRGNKYYMSNYERGVTILDIKDPTAPQEIGYFDTYSASNNASFNGNWGVYPYLPSGIILASDIQGGLFILKDETLDSQSDTVGFAQRTQSIDESAEDNPVRFEVLRQGTGNISVDYRVLYLSAEQEDLEVTSGTLEWQANEPDSLYVELAAVSDGINEFTEMFALTLSNAKGGDIINEQSIAFVSIIGTAANTGVLELSQTEITVLETQARLSIEVQRTGGSEQAISAQATINDISAIDNEDYRLTNGSNSQMLSWAEGDDSSRFIEIDIIDDVLSESAEQLSITLSAEDRSLLGAVRETLITILDDESNIAPTVSAGADFQVNTRQSFRLNNAQVSDDNPDIEVLWTQTAGNTVSIDNESSLNPTVVFSQTPGSITLELTATDIFGVQSSDSVDINVIAPEIVAAPSPSDSGGGSLQFISIFLLLLFAQYRKLGDRTYLKC